MKLYCELCDLEQTVGGSGQATPSCDNCGEPLSPTEDFSVRTDAMEQIPSRAGDEAVADGGEDLTETRAESGPQRLGGYRIVEHVATGGFGSVYRGHDPTLDRHVAIKVPLRKRLAAHGAEAFVREARTLARLDHPHIVPIFEAGLDEESRLPYIVMKWIEGCTLAKYAKQHPPRLPCEESARIIACVAEGLHYAHKMGFVHRDLKPANILIDTEGHPYVTDFGLALHEDHQQQVRNQVAGTLAYMAPEQLRGDSQFLDGRADIWGLGVMLYELLAGKRPFLAHNKSHLIEEIYQRDFKPLSQIEEAIPRHLESACNRCLQKNPADRFSNCKEVAEAVLNLQPNSGYLSRRALVGLGTAGLAAGLGVGWTFFNRPAGYGKVEKVVWSDESSMEISSGNLMLTSNTRAMVRIGELKEPRLHLQFVLHSPTFYTGGVTVFFGLQNRTGPFQMVFVFEAAPGEPGTHKLTRKLATYHPQTVYISTGGSPPNAKYFNLGRDRSTVWELKIENNSLYSGRIGGKILDDLFQTPESFNCYGEFGFVVSSGKASFRNLEINGERCELYD